MQSLSEQLRLACGMAAGQHILHNHKQCLRLQLQRLAAVLMLMVSWWWSRSAGADHPSHGHLNHPSPTLWVRLKTSQMARPRAYLAYICGFPHIIPAGFARMHVALACCLIIRLAPACLCQCDLPCVFSPDRFTP